MTNIPTKMRALALTEPSADFVLSDLQIDVPQITSKQILVKVECVGLNPVDSKLALSGYPSWQYPHTPGLDGVGIVVDSYTPACPLIGKRVMWHGDLSKQGVLAEYVVIEAHAVSVVPEDIDAQTAAALPCAGMTALQSLCQMQVQQGETILIDGGSGAVGQYAIQLAKHRGLNVFATASKKNLSFVKKLGADEVFDYMAHDLEQSIQCRLGPMPLDAVLDTVGGELTARNLRLLKFGGQIACLNGFSETNQDLLFEKAPSIHIIALGGAWLSGNLCAQHKLSIKGDHLLKDIQSKRLSTPCLTTIAFDALAVTQAMHSQIDGSNFGKQIVAVSQ
ncbi:alcohol dehydrogenase [Thalassotalea loyana]|uniref:Alcohol dehydrogenase n=1 Tax=Thalassotalea loyana TaxID=280483 RepID=A0ABQ6HBJ4_9GAMM|nr:zinc-binding dehydrogenase [Thalassotalea loyana]GLX85482.1 alcohol dehydrogenase [Thalassotalea loyana]